MHEQQPEEPEEQPAGERPEPLPDVTPTPLGEVRRDERPQIWVGSWSDYNNGILHGRWIDAAREPDELQADIDRILLESPTAKRDGQPAEEWGIFDYDNFHAVRLNEQDSLSFVSKVACGITAHGPAYAAWANLGPDETELDTFEERYIGHFQTVQEFALQLVDEAGYQEQIDAAIPEGMRQYVYFDLSGLARDMLISGDISATTAPHGGVFIFHGY